MVVTYECEDITNLIFYMDGTLEEISEDGLVVLSGTYKKTKRKIYFNLDENENNPEFYLTDDKDYSYFYYIYNDELYFDVYLKY